MTMKEYKQQWYQKNRSRILAKRKQGYDYTESLNYRKANLERIHARERRHRENNRERYKEIHRKYREEHPDYFKEAGKSYRQKKGAKQLRELYYDPPEKRIRIMVNSARRRCLKDGREFDPGILTVLLQSRYESCACCGNLLDFAGTGRLVNRTKRELAPTIDRIDNDRGYTADNVAILCFRCNMTKGAGRIEEFEMVIDYIKQHVTRPS